LEKVANFTKSGNFTEEDFEEILFILFRRINFYSEDIFSDYIKKPRQWYNEGWGHKGYTLC